MGNKDKHCKSGIPGRKKRQIVNTAIKYITSQRYDHIVKKCQRKRCLFTDPVFPANNKSIDAKNPVEEQISWMRPTELSRCPEFIADGVSRFDVRQGTLGNCWFVAAVANLTCHPMLSKVVPFEQTFKRPDYVGAFRFNFWYQGEWVEVVVDDQLPVVGNRLVYMNSENTNEFWSSLLEKAYAKLYGSYMILKGGQTNAALQDMTGGVAESILKRMTSKESFQMLTKAVERDSMIGCGMIADPTQKENILPNGLVQGHAYSITDVTKIYIKVRCWIGSVSLIRIRNPWGLVEWKGPWSDGSKEWEKVTPEEKQKLEIVVKEDGEFWMCADDFSGNFTKFSICHIGPDDLNAPKRGFHRGEKRWMTIQDHGAWVPRCSAGGQLSDDTFHTNPQYLVELTDPDDDDNLCSLLVAVLQKDRQRNRGEGPTFLKIGIRVFPLIGNWEKTKTNTNEKTAQKEKKERKEKKQNWKKGRLDLNYFRQTKSSACSILAPKREMTCRIKLPPGTYVIVPYTKFPNSGCEFLLRIFTEKQSTAEEMDEDSSYTRPQRNTNCNRHDATEPSECDLLIPDGLDKISESFTKLDREKSGLDVNALQTLLQDLLEDKKSEYFTPAMCRSLLALMTTGESEKVELPEFMTVYELLREWTDVFKKFVQDDKKMLSSFDLRYALNTCGFSLSNKCLCGLVTRYSNREGEITYSDFLLCATRLKTMFELYDKLDSSQTGQVKFGVREFLETTA